MTKQFRIKKEKALLDILSEVAEQNDLETLRIKVNKIGILYFPNADLMFLNALYDYAYYQQHLANYTEILHSECNRYYRENLQPHKRPKQKA